MLYGTQVALSSDSSTFQKNLAMTSGFQIIKTDEQWLHSKHLEMQFFFAFSEFGDFRDTLWHFILGLYSKCHTPTQTNIIQLFSGVPGWVSQISSIFLSSISFLSLCWDQMYLLHVKSKNVLLVVLMRSLPLLNMCLLLIFCYLVWYKVRADFPFVKFF